MIAVLLLSLLLAGVLFFADELDAARQDLRCPCGRHEMRAVLVTSEDQAREIERGLAANCPWCTAHQAASKGVDVHA